MENSHLNKAHMYGRRAEHFAKSRRYDEAMECHRKAVFHFDETLKIKTSSVVQESLQLQRKYHLKQVDYQHMRKHQHERYMRALEYQRRKNPEFLAQQIDKTDKYNELQVAIYHNLDDTDGLLESLGKSVTGTSNQSVGSADGTKVVSELVGLNHSLHILIQKMSQSIDEYATENEELRDKLRYYEREKECDESTNKAGDSPGSANKGLSSFNTQRDLKLDNMSSLAPLEMPVFDLSEFENH